MRLFFNRVLDKNTKLCYNYDTLSRVTELTVKNATTNAVISTETFTYDAAGNIIGSSADDTFVYDTNNRLISYNGSTVIYDADGNMLSNGSLTCTYDSANRLITAGDHTYTYNAEGVRIRNQREDADTTYEYDTIYPDRLVSFNGNAITYDAQGYPTLYKGKFYSWSRGKLSRIYRGSSTQAGSTYEDCTFAYDAYGQRTSKSYVYDVNPGVSGDDSCRYNTTYQYDHSGRLIREFITECDAQNVEVTREFIYLYDECGIVGVMYSANGSTPQPYYYHRNLQGDVIAIYDASGEKKVEYAYDAWGNCTVVYAADIGLADTNPIRYRGYYFDRETGLYYLNARYYSSEWRRFISPDAAEYIDPETPNGLNLYAYCNNDPVNYADPSGHFAISTFLIGLAVSSLVTWGLSEIFGAQIVGGASSMVNGYAAITTGIGLLSFGLVGWIAGGLLIIAGAGAMIIGANEVVDGITGTNYIQEWTGWSDDLYTGLYIGSNIVSSVGTIAGNIYMKYNPPYPGRNPNKIPDGFNDRVNPKANYYNPKTDQSLRPDLNHAEPIGPHWDWIDSNGVGWRLYRFWRKRK